MHYIAFLATGRYRVRYDPETGEFTWLAHVKPELVGTLATGGQHNQINYTIGKGYTATFAEALAQRKSVGTRRRRHVSIIRSDMG